jgi:hypothetical protein
MHPLSNTREGLIQIPAAAANLTPGLLAKIDSNGKAALAGLSSAPVTGRYVVIESDATTATLLPIEPGRQVRVTLYGDCNPGEELACTVESKAIRKADTTGLSSVLVAEEAGVDGQMVLARGIAAYVEPAPPDELPAIAEGDAAKVLAVKADESGVEWTTPAAGALPEQGSGNPNNSILEVTDGTPAWRDAPRELPDHDGQADGNVVGIVGGAPAWRTPRELPEGGNAGDVLTVGTVPEWQPPAAPTVAQLEAAVALLPTSDPYEAGKLYVDSGTIKVSAGV